MADRFKPRDTVISEDGLVALLLKEIDPDLWVVYDYDFDDEVVWDLDRRGAAHFR